MSRISSLLTRVQTAFVGPRQLPTGDAYEDGNKRQIAQPPITQTRWLLSDYEGAIITADNGVMQPLARLWRSIRRDGRVKGVLSTRTDGLVQLPKRFAGDQEIAEELEQDFDTVFPPAELALMSADGDGMGVALGEFVQVAGALPALVRRDPEPLRYRWWEDRWYFQSRSGLLPVNPGDGRWVLHCPGGAQSPWQNGLCLPLARAFIAKDHAYFHRENYSSKLANAARVATSPQGANGQQRLAFFKKVAAWAANTVFDLPAGWDVKILESNGRGYEVFKETIADCNEEIVITIAGQTVTTDGGAGFQNSDIHKTIRADLIQSDANALAATLNTQGLPVYVNEKFGGDAMENRPVALAWDVTPPADQTKEAAALVGAANAISQLNEALAPYGKEVDVDVFAQRFGVPARDVRRKVAELTALRAVRRVA
jgi:hypothetical protein